MMDLAFSVDGVLAALAAQPRRADGAGRAIMFVAARREDAVTAPAQALAETAGPGAVYAIDLDFKRNALGKALSAHGEMGPPIDGRLNGLGFYGLRSPEGSPMRETTPLFCYRRVGRSRVYVGGFNVAALSKGVRVGISSAPHYWNAVRAGGAVAVVDAPSLDRSSMALRVAPHMDGVVLVVGSDAGAAPAAIAARDALANAGANLLGLVYVGATAPVLAIDRLLRQAG